MCYNMFVQKRGENMARAKLVFKSVETIADFKKELQEHNSVSFFNRRNLPIAYQALDDIDDDMQNRFINCLHNIDKRIKRAGSTNPDYFHKVPIILSSAIYFAYFKNAIADYTDDEMLVLSEWSFNLPFESYIDAPKKWTKELLQTINQLDEDPLNLISYINLSRRLLDYGCTPIEVKRIIEKTPREVMRKTEDYIFKHEEEEEATLNEIRRL